MRVMPNPWIASVAADTWSLLVDEMADCRAEWREDATAVKEAYALWSAAATDEKAARFDAYVVALDQEEFAAEAYGAYADAVRAVAFAPVP
jgi:hypothetical protein